MSVRRGCAALLMVMFTAIGCTPAAPVAVPPVSTSPHAPTSPSTPTTPAATPTPSASATASELYLYGHAVDRSEDHEDATDGEACESPWAEAGDAVRLDPGGTEGELATGTIEDGACSFRFNLGQVPEGPRYSITIGKQEPVRVKPTRTKTAMITVELVANWTWTKAERAYLEDVDVDPESADAGDQVASGREVCSELKELRGDALVAHLIEETSSGSEARKAAKHLCGHAKAVRAAGRGFADGTYTVGRGRDLEPGTYETLPKIRDCYWERVDDRGNIRSNEFVSFAPAGIEVTLLETGGGFVTRGCGAWIRR